MNLNLGDWLHYLIKVITLGQGEKISSYIANKLGYEDCGCNARRTYLNNLFLPDSKKKYPIE